MGPNLIAFGIIVMVVLTTTISFFFRVKPWNLIFKGGRIWWSLLATMFAGFFLSAGGHRCEVDAPTPESYIATIAICCLFCLILFMDRKGFLVPCCFFVLGIGILLQNQFEVLVYESNDYYAIDKYTRKPMAKGCSEIKSPDNIALKAQWHSWFTGIYRVKNKA